MRNNYIELVGAELHHPNGASRRYHELCLRVQSRKQKDEVVDYNIQISKRGNCPPPYKRRPVWATAGFVTWI